MAGRKGAAISWRRRAGVAACLLVTVSSGVLSGGSATAQPTGEIPIEPLPVAVLPPELDPFYRAPASDIAATPPGGILKARQITSSYFNVIPEQVDAWQVLYRTNDSHGRATATVTTLIRGRGAPPPAGRKLLSYQIQEDSTAAYCAPSYGLQQGSIPYFSDFLNQFESNIGIAEALSNGYAVSIPDHQGPNSAFAAAILEGQATLDGIRAAENFAPLQLSGKDTPVGLLGYSGGSVPSAWAAENARTYAPELNIAAIGIGGVVMADLPAVARNNNANLFAGLVAPALFGLSTEYPDIKRVLDTKTDWLTRFVTTTKVGLCHTPYGTIDFPFWNLLGGYTGTEPGGLLAEPAIVAAIEDTRLGKNRPSVPLYVYHAQNDEIIPIPGTDRLVDWYCQDPGQSITYTREQIAEHLIGFFSWMAKSYNFVVDRLEGRPARQGCVVDSPTTTITDGELAGMLEETFPATGALMTGQEVRPRPHTPR
ncbi:lipase family protein [Nocardia sp. CDC159]|uniref:Lipase family protein n=1 Tax=Nocardia pulmonis TaxID=2951408 RepID=A0A9X2E7M0_9NOCA|nr:MULTISPECIES: lipase family protein [Nocardia]MCM6773161.1 lipase family protein [Nocardia pulmonis]MCM6785536.1 lipase family protein [Nocardia sp. CDC159]